MLGPLPPTTNSQTWAESIMLIDAEDESLLDLSTTTEVMLILRDQYSKTSVLTLSKSAGQITFPSTGILQWRAERSQMTMIAPKTYDVGMVLTGEGDEVQLLLGTVAVLDGLMF